MSKTFQVTIDDNRSIIGKAFHGGVLFQFANGACITRISLTYAAINSMGQIAEAVKAAEENKKAANAKRRAANAKRRATKGGEAELAAGGGMKPTVYTVHAYRWGDRAWHSYNVGVYLHKQAALTAAKTERNYRGGKYQCEVLEWTLDTSIAGNYDNAAKVIKPLPPMNKQLSGALRPLNLSAIESKGEKA